MGLLIVLLVIKSSLPPTPLLVDRLFHVHEALISNLLFKFELAYAGVFRVTNFPADQVHPVVMIECPRLLFPFARQIVSDAVRNGGFPPLLLDPIDFATLYRQKLAEGQGQQANTPIG